MSVSQPSSNHRVWEPFQIPTKFRSPPLQSLGATALILAALYYWFPGLVIGEGVASISTVFAIALIVGWRSAFEWLARRSDFQERLLLVGTGQAAVNLARELHERYELGVNIVGFIDPDPARVGTPLFNPGVVGTIEGLCLAGPLS